MVWWVIWPIVVVLVVGAVTLVCLHKFGAPKEKGPMPKRHGQFGQSVHGGKS